MRSLLLALLIAMATGLAVAEHPLARQQWQPQTSPPDPRLDQIIEVEIIGRAAVPALALLSEKTGVSLGVAPEDLATVGERKLTIIAKGLPLRAVMVQLPEALQEAHWDVDSRGSQPAYLLHRNSGVDNIPEQVRSRDDDIRSRLQRDRQVGRIAEARRALSMSPAQLSELEKTDIFLARALRDHETRALMEAFCALPDDKIEEQVNTERVTVLWGELPAPAQEALLSAMERAREMESRGSPESSPIPSLRLPPDFSIGFVGAEGSVRIWNGRPPAVLVIPDRYAYGSLAEELLEKTGMSATEASETIRQWEKKRWQADAEERRARREQGAVESFSPKLHHPFSLGKTSLLSDLQHRIADEVGISIISDYFTDEWLSISDPTQQNQELPLWRLLYLLSHPDDYSRWDGRGVFEWRSAGDCLVFHRTAWYDEANRELPESLLLSWRETLRRQGHFTVDDVVAAAAVLTRRTGGYALPGDLSDAGIPNLETSRLLLFFNTLSSAQTAKAASPSGLLYDEMTSDQQEQMRAMLSEAEAEDPAVSPVFRARKWQGQMNLRPMTRFEFAIGLPGEPCERSGYLYLPGGAPPAAVSSR
jgi:hypothetical protein